MDLKAGDNCIVRVKQIQRDDDYGYPPRWTFRYARVLEPSQNAVKYPDHYLVNIQTKRGVWQLDKLMFRSHVGWIHKKYIYTPT